MSRPLTTKEIEILKRKRFWRLVRERFWSDVRKDLWFIIPVLLVLIYFIKVH